MTASPTTHCRLLTPPGAGAIGVVRVQGPEAPRIVESMFIPGITSATSCNAAPCGWTTGLSHRVRYGRIMDGADLLDTGVVSLAAHADGPAFDLCVHGGVRVIERTLALIQRHGAEPITTPPRAWSVRTSIERDALSALISAKTQRAVRFLAWQFGHLADHLRSLAARACTDVQTVRREWNALLAASETALPLVDGARVALVGLPNCGKSTIFNRLLGREAAVATPLAGTTRDWVSAELDLRGVGVTLIDTAGCRRTTDSLEHTAVVRGRVSAESANLVVVVVDGTGSAEEAVASVTGWADATTKVIVAINKIDLAQRLDHTAPEQALAEYELPALPVSALLGTGFDQLMDRIVGHLGVPPEGADRRPAFFSAPQLDLARSLVPVLHNDPADFAHRLSACFVRSTWDCSVSGGI